MKLLMAFLIAFCVFIIAALLFACIEYSNDCKAKGEEIVGTGEYTTTYVMSGKVMVPITNEITKCSK